MTPSFALPALATFTKGKKTQNRVTLDDHGGRVFLNIRQWYQSPAGTWMPTKRGTTFEVEELHDLEQAVHEAIRRTLGGNG